MFLGDLDQDIKPQLEDFERRLFEVQFYVKQAKSLHTCSLITQSKGDWLERDETAFNVFFKWSQKHSVALLQETPVCSCFERLSQAIVQQPLEELLRGTPMVSQSSTFLAIVGGFFGSAIKKYFGNRYEKHQCQGA